MRDGKIRSVLWVSQTKNTPTLEDPVALNNKYRAKQRMLTL